MKTYIYILLSSLSLCFLAFYYDPYIKTKLDTEKINELASITHPIRTIDPADTNYQDLLFLKEKLKNVDMVMLGEQQHGDGSTFLAKSRLVKFLHQELNFDVLLFESGIYDCSLLWDGISGNSTIKSNDFRDALFYFWGGSNETKDLRSYITQHAQSNHPLIFGGFDMQFSGDMSYLKRIQLMESYLIKKNIQLKKDYPSFLKILEDYRYNTLAYPSKQISAIEKQAVFNEIERLNTVLTKDAKTNEDKIFVRYILGIQTDLKSKWLYPGNEYKQNITRDSMMAENTIWLKDNSYKNKKVIIWAANSHILHHTDHLKHLPFYYKRMGTYLKDRYGPLCYGINFTSYLGKTCNTSSGDHDLINASTASSIESMLHATGNPFAFIDFINIPKNSFLTQKITAKFLGHSNSTACWSKMTDGIFFIDEMKPITFN